MPRMTVFCYLASDGVQTNLQLYSLRQALRCRQEMRAEVENGLPEGNVRERCVHIVTTLGTSLSQLLGQNVESQREVGVDGPGALGARLLAGLDMEHAEKEELRRQYAEFLEFYDACRHFGPPHHGRIDQLDTAKVDSLIALTLRMWNVVLRYRKGHDTDADLHDFESIEVVLAELAQWEPFGGVTEEGPVTA